MPFKLVQVGVGNGKDVTTNGDTDRTAISSSMLTNVCVDPDCAPELLLQPARFDTETQISVRWWNSISQRSAVHVDLVDSTGRHHRWRIITCLVTDMHKLS